MKIYKKVKSLDNTTSETTILGISVYRRCRQKDVEKRRILFFSISNSTSERAFFIFGLKIYRRKASLLERGINSKLRIVTRLLYEEPYVANSVAKLHGSVFPQFRNLYRNKSVVIVGAGPSLSYYRPILDAIHIGVNKTFLCKHVKLDYLFMLDYVGVWDYIKMARNYNCVKFYGRYAHSDIPKKCNIPDYIAEEAKAYRFYSDNIRPSDKLPIKYDIECSPLMDFNTVATCALHFALYTRPKRIYLVGCDCSLGGYFDNTQQNEKTHLNFPILHGVHIKGYNQIKQFVRSYYPETKIVSVNPIGLRGIFRDVYTKEYLEANPKTKAELGDKICYVENDL